MKLQQDETLLLQGKCLLHRGPLSHIVEFVVTTQRFRYFPIHWVDRIVGVRSTTVHLKEIVEAKITGEDPILSIHMKNKIIRLSQGDLQNLHLFIQSFNNPITEKGTRKEKQLMQDQCLYHRGPIAHNVEVVLTTDKLLLYSTGTLDRMMGMKSKRLACKSFTKVEVKGMDRHILLHMDKVIHRFSNNGAHRMLPLLKKIIRYYQGTQEEPQSFQPILSQGPIQVFRLGPLAINGEFVLKRDELRIQTFKGLVPMLLGGVDLTIPLGDESVQMAKGSTEQKLGITHANGTVWLGGKKVAVMHFFLEQLKG